jgi:hypothetical protein
MMLAEALKVLAAELRRQARGEGLPARRVDLDADQVQQLASRVERISKLEAGRLRRSAARLKGIAIAVPYRPPPAQLLLDVAGEIDAVMRQLVSRGRPAGGDAA